MNRVFINIFLTAAAVIIFIGCNSGFYIVFPEKNNNISFSLFFEDNFDDKTTGTEPDGYGIINSGASVLVADTPSVSGKSLHFNDTVADGIEVTKDFSLSDDYIKIIYSVYPVQTDTRMDVFLKGPAFDYISRITFYRTGVIQYEDDTGMHDITSYISATWYKIETIVDFNTRTCDYYIDDVLVASDRSFVVPSIAEAEHLTFSSDWSLTCEYYLDNVSILQAN